MSAILPGDATPPVPDAYRGVWSRTLLRTPSLTDTSTFVRWLQTSRWHADLRVPLEARPARPDLQQGFSGVTEVEHASGEERCHWHRRVDFQPPGLHPDCGRVAFETPDRLIETGVHADYLEIWERLPESTGRFVVLEAPGVPAPAAATRWLLAGTWLMRVRPRRAAWPAGTAIGTSLHEVLRAQPQAATALLDFEISFGRLARGRWQVSQSTLPALEGSEEAVRIERIDVDTATVDAATVGSTPATTRWRVVEWRSDADRID